jgi:cyanophycinase-like exopeptidase
VSLLVVMGSGETAPTMVRIHREVFAATGDGQAAMVDTPFAFQNNADELVERTLAYFSESLGRTLAVASWRRRDDPVLDQEKALRVLRSSAWAFVGPGSPTYALRQWTGTALPAALVDVVGRGGTLVMGSAAAATLGTHAVPVYEIYKAGADPYWAEGIDVLGSLTGLAAVVVPHYNNREGGTHDTRFCYLGERRLALMEQQLPPATGVLGVDEHTALLIDTVARHATVAGSGVLTVRWRGQSRTFAAGTVLGFDDLAALLAGDRAAAVVAAAGPVAAPAEPDDVTDSPEPLSLRASADDAERRFESSLAARDADGCVGAVLDLEAAIHSWSADTLQSDEQDHARQVLRTLVVRLGELAEVGARDPRSVVEPYVEALLSVRAAARAAKDFATSDLVRDRLTDAGVEVRDTPDGVDWTLRGP